MDLVTADLGTDCARGSPILRFPMILWDDRQETERGDLSALRFCHRFPMILWQDRQEKDRSGIGVVPI